MTRAHECDTEELVRRAGDGDDWAARQLLTRHRGRLRQMVAVRMDPRLVTRIDPSDVVQEALMEASRKLPTYLSDRPLPFYPWLRQIAWERLVDLHRRHIRARKRAVGREDWRDTLSDASAAQLADQLSAGGPGPGSHAVREELHGRVRTALARLAPRDREVLVLRHLEQLSTREIASILDVSEGVIKTRHLRALQRLRGLLEDEA